MRQELLLIKDVDDLGRSGDIVSVKSGYARNYLVPQQMAIIATKETVRKQEKLKKERAVLAAVDRKEAEDLSKGIEGKILSIDVKVDKEGKMYGSVSSGDIVELFAKEGIAIERKSVQLRHAIKDTGVKDIVLKLKEGVTATFQLKINPEVEAEK